MEDQSTEIATLYNTLPVRFRAILHPNYIEIGKAHLFIQTTEISLESFKKRLSALNNNGINPLYIFNGNRYLNITQKDMHFRLRAHSIERHLLNALYGELEGIYGFSTDRESASGCNYKAMLYLNKEGEIVWFSPFRRYRDKYFLGVITKIDFHKLDIAMLNTDIGTIAIFVDRTNYTTQETLF